MNKKSAKPFSKVKNNLIKLKADYLSLEKDAL